MTLITPATGDFIQTYSGRVFYPLAPVSSDVNIHDIAHSLAHLCRFNGHTREFYSVAQHCVLVSRHVASPWELDGLLHDAAEAYISDVALPIKPHLLNYKEIEDRIHQAVARRYGVMPEIPAVVKHVDRVLLATERRDLLELRPDVWPAINGIHPLDEEIRPWSPRRAKEEFLQRFAELYMR